MIYRNAPHAFNATRCRLIQGAALGAATLAAPALARAQSGPVIRIGFWPVAAGLPFYAAVVYFQGGLRYIRPGPTEPPQS